MDYKIIDISSGELQIKTTGGSANPDTILSTMTFTEDKSHTDTYYLVVNVLLEYAGQTGQVVLDLPEVMTATYDTDGFLSTLTQPVIPTKQDILDAIEDKAQDWIDNLNKKDLLRTYVESVRNIVDTYDYELEDSRFTKPFDSNGSYDELFGLTSEIGSNENRTIK